MIFRAPARDYPQVCACASPPAHGPLIVTLASMDEIEPEVADTGHVHPPLSGQIGSVTGRFALGGKRGSPGLEELSLHLDDGRRLAFGLPHGGEERTMRGLADIELGSFILARHDDAGALEEPATIVCAICFAPADTAEHVPQTALGGRLMTRTCAACNNGLGSRVEPDLEAWFDSRLVQVAFENGEVVPGRRRAGDLHYLKSETGEFALVAHEGLPEGVEKMLHAGELEMHWREPEPSRYRTAALKHAYLAACLHLQTIPSGDDAEAVRSALLQARDADRRGALAMSKAAERIRILRSTVGRQGPPLALVTTAERGEVPAIDEVYISLAGALFVSWPLLDTPPATPIARPQVPASSTDT